MLIDGIWMVSFHELFQFLSDTVRLSHQPLAFLFALLRCYLHLVTATDGFLIVDDELLVLLYSSQICIQPKTEFPRFSPSCLLFTCILR